MIPVLLIAIPLAAGLLSFFLRAGNSSRTLVNAERIGIFGTGIVGTECAHRHSCSIMLPGCLHWAAALMLQMDGMAKMLVLLTAIAFPVVYVSTAKNNYASPNQFFAVDVFDTSWFGGCVCSSRWVCCSTSSWNWR